MTIKIPESHHYLLASVYDVILTTITPKGFPHSTVVWSSFDGTNILLNTGRGYKKERNMRKNPKVTVFSYDPKKPEKWIEVHGSVELIEENAIDHLNELSFKYTGKYDFYKDVMPELDEKEVSHLQNYAY